SVWSAVARAQGGMVGGFDEGQLAAYYVVWTLVRVYNTAFDPKAWEWRIRQGRINTFLSQPVHMFHRDFSFFMGSKIAWTILWIPIAVVLTLVFRPSTEWHVVNVAAFAIAIWGGYAVRFLVLYVMGMSDFWTSRGAAMFGIVSAAGTGLLGAPGPAPAPPRLGRVHLHMAPVPVDVSVPHRGPHRASRHHSDRRGHRLSGCVGGRVGAVVHGRLETS